MRCAMFRDGVARLLVFRLGAERFAVSLSAVEEVVEAPPLAHVPDAPAGVLGIATLRGGFVTVYDPRPLLGVQGPVTGPLLVFVRDDRRVGVAVGDVLDAIVAEDDEVLQVPGSQGSDGILIGVIRRPPDLIAILDANALLDAATAVTEGDRP